MSFLEEAVMKTRNVFVDYVGFNYYKIIESIKGNSDLKEEVYGYRVKVEIDRLCEEVFTP